MHNAKSDFAVNLLPLSDRFRRREKGPRRAEDPRVAEYSRVAEWKNTRIQGWTSKGKAMFSGLEV